MNTFNSKTKLLATITIMLLFASAMLAVVPSANAVSSVVANPTSGPVGTTVNIQGDATNVGTTVTAYLDGISTTNPIIIGSQRLTGSNLHFNFNVIIPETYEGLHAIIVQESFSGVVTDFATFTVTSKLTATPARGLSGDSITLKGTGFSQTTTTPNHPVTLTTVTFNGVALTVSPSNVRTDVNGSFSVTFNVPNLSYGSYTIEVTDSDGATATVPFVIGPVLSLSQTSGPVGTMVTINGRGFTSGATIINTVSYLTGIQFGSLTISSLSGNTTVNPSGTFSISILVPDVANTPSNDPGYLVTVTENGGSGSSGSAYFKVAGQARITASPNIGTPTTNNGIGDTISFTGTNFTRIAGAEVRLWLQHTTYGAFEIGNFTTNANGGFSGTFVVPAVPTSDRDAGLTYKLCAEDEYGIATDVNFVVAITQVVLTPPRSSYVTGETLNIKGYGFNANGSLYTANVTVNGQLIKTDIPAAQVAGGFDWVISSLLPGTYPISIVNSYGIHAETSLVIKESTTVIATPSPATRASTLNITGVYFTPGAAIDIQIRNVTTGIPVSYASATANATGGFSILFNIAANYNLGDYIINATDTSASKLTAETSLSVVKVSINITVGASTYKQSDVGTFRLTSNSAPTGTISVYDSSTNLVVPIVLTAANWVSSGSGDFVYTQITEGGVSAGALFRIASDARVGTWTWNATINDANEPQKYNGTFTVTSNTATPTPPASTPPASTPPATSTPPASTPPASTPPASTPPAASTPTPTPEEPGRDWTKVIIIIAVIALIVGVIAVFLFVTMRRKIAN